MHIDGKCHVTSMMNQMNMYVTQVGKLTSSSQHSHNLFLVCYDLIPFKITFQNLFKNVFRVYWTNLRDREYRLPKQSCSTAASRLWPMSFYLVFLLSFLSSLIRLHYLSSIALSLDRLFRMILPLDPKLTITYINNYFRYTFN